MVDKKNVPTPKRSVAEAKNFRPIVLDQGTKKSRKSQYKNLSKEEKQALKAKEKLERKELRDKQELAMRTGEGPYLPEQDKGKVRKFIRNWCDERTFLAQFFLPVAFFVLVIATIFSSIYPALSVIFSLLIYLLIGYAFVEVFIRTRKLKKELIEKFGDETVQRGSGNMSYAFSRLSQPKKMRRPIAGV